MNVTEVYRSRDTVESGDKLQCVKIYCVVSAAVVIHRTMYEVNYLLMHARVREDSPAQIQ